MLVPYPQVKSLQLIWRSNISVDFISGYPISTWHYMRQGTKTVATALAGTQRTPLVEVMAWCRLAPSHYLSQCWPRSMSPYSITKPQRVNQSSWKRSFNKSTQNANWQIVPPIQLVSPYCTLWQRVAYWLINLSIIQPNTTLTNPMTSICQPITPKSLGVYFNVG